MNKWLCIVFLIAISLPALGQKFQSHQSGNWNDPNTWEFDNGSGFSWPAPTFPTNANSISILVQAGHTVTVTAGVTIDQTAVSGTLGVIDPVVLTLVNGTGNDLTVAAGGTLDMQGESIVKGGATSGNLVVSGNLNVGSVNATGAIVTGTTAGNIQILTRVYNSGATITYAGTTGPQFMGSGNPNKPGVDAVINNGSGVSLASTVTIGNNLIVSSGNMNITTGAAILTLTVKNDLNLSGGSLVLNSGTANATLAVNHDITGGNTIQSSGINSNVTINGSGALTNAFPFASGSQYELITINRSGYTLTFPFGNNVAIKSLKISSGNVITNDNLTLSGDLNLIAGSTLTFSGHDLTLQGRFDNLVGYTGTLVGNASSNLNITGAGTLGTLAFSPAGNTINSLTLDRLSGGTLVTLNSSLTVNSTINLNDGTFANTSGLNVASGLIINRNSNASMTGIAPAGGPFDVIYSGANMTTGAEALGPVRNVTSNDTGTVTLGNDLTASGTLLVNSGIFTASTKNLSVATADIVSGSTLNAPMNTATTGLTIAGGFINDGTFNNKNGSLIISGAATLTGANINATNFYNIQVKSGASLTPSATLNIQGNFQNDGTFIPATGTVVFSGVTGAKTVSGTANTQFYDVVLNKSNSGISLSVTSPETVTHSLTLSHGQLDITASNLVLNAGTTLTKNSSASISNTGPGGGTWNLIYTGTTQTTSFEIPASGNVLSLTNNITSGQVTLAAGQSLQVTNSFSNPVVGSAFMSGGNDVSVGSFSNAGTFKAPTSSAPTGLTIAGSFVNDGTFTHNNGNAIFNGAIALTGANISTTNFYNFKINGGAVITPPANLNIQGSLVNNGTLNTGSGTVTFSGMTGSQTISGSTSTQFYDLVLNKNNVGISLSVNSPQTVTHSMTLTNGQLDIIAGALSLNAGTTLTRSNLASISTTSPGGGPWNLVYVNGSMATSLEIPSSQVVLSLTDNMNSASILNLSSNLSVTGAITVNPQAVGPTFTSGNNDISAGSLVNSGVFNAPTNGHTLTLTGDLINTGIFNGGLGVVIFNGVSLISGTNINFADFTINPGATATLAASPTLSIAGNFVNNGTLVSGTGTIVFTGSLGGKTLSGTTQTQFYNLTLNKINAGTSITFTTPQSVTHFLTLNDGILNNTNNGLTMGSGSTISVNATAAASGSVTGVVPAGGPYDLVYTGDANVTPALEIQGSLNNLINNNTAIVALGAPINIGGLVIVNAGTLTSGANTINTTGVTLNGGTFNAPSTTLTLTGDFTDNATFNHNSGTVVFNGNSNILGSVSPLFNKVIISGTLNGPANFLLAGDFTNNGSFVSASGKVSFNGSTLQNILGANKTTFNDIDVNNAASPVSVSVERDTDLKGVLTLGAGAQLDADGAADASLFTVLSLNDAPTQDGSIAAIPGSAAVLGKVNVQRYVSAKDDDDRYFSSPVTNATVAQLQNVFAVTGPFTGTSFPCTGCLNNGFSLTYYSETAAGTFKNGFRGTPVTGGSNTEILVPGRGYDAWMWNGVAPFTAAFLGPINQGTIPYNVTYTNSGTPAADGWNLLGNPFPSAIQWNNGPGWSRSNIDPTVWLWDLRVSAWHTYNYLTAVGDLPNGTIATGQSFWVVTTSAAPSMSVNELAKSSAGGSYFRERSNPFEGIQVSIRKGQSQDNSFILFDDRATAAYDMGIDAPKMEMGVEKLFIAPQDEEKQKFVTYAVNRSYSKDIPLFIHAALEGEYEISFAAIGGYANAGDMYLVDTYLHKQVALSITSPYVFTVTQNKLTKGNRFFLTRQPGFSFNEVNPIQLSCYPNPVSSTLIIEVNSRNVQHVSFIDITGNTLGSIILTASDGEISKGTFNMGDLPAGIYFVRAVVEEGILVQKVLKY